MLERYLNYDHGLELYPDINTSHRGNENGIVFLVAYFILKQLNGEELTKEDEQIFTTIVEGLEVKPGLYDRGKSDKYRENPKRSISHDNISAISSGSKMFGTNHAEEIADYGVKHFFVFNNNQRGFSLPMNPGNYSIWLANANKYKILEILFLPFFLINFIITMSKKKEDTSSKLLYLIELYPLRHRKFYGLIFEVYMEKIAKQYSPYMSYIQNDGLEELFSIYYKDENHPNNILARNL